MTETVKRPDGSLMFLAGMTRSGKTALASQLAAGRSRAAAWDVQGDWTKYGLERVLGLHALARKLLDHPTAPLRVSVKAALDKPMFGEFCRLAESWGKLEPCLVIVEETAWVTDPGKAPRGWLELVTGGLKYGIDLVAITQRPSESDKTSLSQADSVYCFQMERVADQKYMAGELGVDVKRVAALRPLHYLRKYRRTGGAVTEGRVTFDD